MADTIARALRLIALLQSAPVRTAGVLSERLGVDERTVRRDAARLLDAGVPVETLRGRHGGYRLAGGPALPLTFSGEEAVALALGLARAHGDSGEPRLVEQTALAKIRRTLSPEDERRLDGLLGVADGSREGRPAPPDPVVMLTLAEAVDLRRVLDLRYRDGRGTPSRRTVHPVGLVAHARRWYLIAFDAAKKEERTFRVDRMLTVRATSTTFPPPRSSGDAEHLLDLFAGADYRWRVVLRIRAEEEHIRRHLPAGVARLSAVEDSAAEAGADGPPWRRAEIRADRLDWLPGVIAALDCGVVVEEPEELRSRVRETAARLRRAAGAGSRGP